MKVEQLVGQYLYNNKRVSLQNIGNFTISPQVNLPAESDKDVELPPGSIHFVYNPHEEQDEGFIDFIVQQTRKIKPLATSDLESYGILGRQFLNIGKPFYIPGVGTLQKSQAGMYEFEQGNYMNARVTPPPVYQEKQEEAPDFASLPREKKSNAAAWIFGLFILIIIAGALFYFLNREEKEQPVAIEQSALQEDTTSLAEPAVVDSSAMASQTLTTPQPDADGYNFKIIIKNYSSKTAADNAYKRLSSYGHKLLLYTVDSTNYQLAIPFKRPLTDTTRVKDSLAVFFQTKTAVRL